MEENKYEEKCKASIKKAMALIDKRIEEAKSGKISKEIIKQAKERRWIIDFTKTIHGYMEVRAKNKEEAQEKANSGNVVEEFDNKSEYVFTSIAEVRKMK